GFSRSAIPVFLRPSGSRPPATSTSPRRPAWRARQPRLRETGERRRERKKTLSSGPSYSPERERAPESPWPLVAERKTRTEEAPSDDRRAERSNRCATSGFRRRSWADG